MAKKTVTQLGAGDGPACGRRDDLMDYLYQEAGPSARAAFERHLDGCGLCRAELQALNLVRDDLSAWQIGFAPRLDVALPRSRGAALRELLRSLFLEGPVWARGMAWGTAAALALLVTASLAGVSLRVQQGDFALQFGRGGVAPKAVTGSGGPSSEEVERLVQQAVAREREKLSAEFAAQMADFKQQVDTRHQGEIEAVSAKHEARIDAMKASLREEIRRSNRQRPSIRSFFAMEDAADQSGGGSQ